MLASLISHTRNLVGPTPPLKPFLHPTFVNSHICSLFFLGCFLFPFKTWVTTKKWNKEKAQTMESSKATKKNSLSEKKKKTKRSPSRKVEAVEVKKGTTPKIDCSPLFCPATNPLFETAHVPQFPPSDKVLSKKKEHDDPIPGQAQTSTLKHCCEKHVSVHFLFPLFILRASCCATISPSLIFHTLPVLLLCDPLFPLPS